MRRRSERKAKVPEESPGKSTRKSTRNSEPLEVQVQDIELPAGESSLAISNDGIQEVPMPESEESDKNKPAEPLVTEEAGQGSDESTLWKVQSSNGAGDGGEIQKLKICRQRPTESPEIGETALRKRLSRCAKDGRSTDDSTHEESEKDTKKKYRTRTSSKNSPLVSPTVVCDISDVSPTKIKIINVSNVNTDKEPTILKAVENSVTVSNEVNQEKKQSSEISEIALPVVEVAPSNPEAANKQLINKSSPKSEPSLERECNMGISPKIEENESKTEESKENNDVKESTPSRDRSSSSESESSQNSSKPKKVKKRRRDLQSMIQRKVNSAVSLKNESSDSEDANQKKNVDCGISANTNEARKESTDNKENQSESQPIDDDIKAPETNNEELRPLIRKRRWGSSKANRFGEKSILQISTDTLKNLIPDAKPVAADELQLSIEEEEEGQLDDDDDDDIVVMVAKEEETQLEQERQREDSQKERDLEERKKRQERQERFEKANQGSEAKRAETSGTRKVKIVSEDEKKLARHPSPPRRKSNSVLYITHLVRPFTVQQLKNLLLRTGTIVENGFWMDKIKSKCYVEYTTEDMAVETRHALHGVRWPTSNPKTLVVEFATHDDLLMAQAISEEPDVPRKSEPLDMVEGWVAEQARIKDRNQRIVREWDVGKPEHPDEALLEYEIKAKEKEKRELERKARKERHHRSLSPEIEPVRKARRKEEDAPAKLLDDLFRKTKASPCIYWLPLTPEQIAVKEEMRRKHMAEHERRMAEMKKADMARRERERRSRK